MMHLLSAMKDSPMSCQRFVLVVATGKKWLQDAIHSGGNYALVHSQKPPSCYPCVIPCNSERIIFFKRESSTLWCFGIMIILYATFDLAIYCYNGMGWMICYTNITMATAHVMLLAPFFHALGCIHMLFWLCKSKMWSDKWPGLPHIMIRQWWCFMSTHDRNPRLSTCAPKKRVVNFLLKTLIPRCTPRYGSSSFTHL